MNTTKYRNQIKKIIDCLPEDKLGVAEDFLEDLLTEEEIDATEELLAIPGFVEAMDRAKQQMAEGKVRNWEEIKKFYE